MVSKAGVEVFENRRICRAVEVTGANFQACAAVLHFRQDTLLLCSAACSEFLDLHRIFPNIFVQTRSKLLYEYSGMVEVIVLCCTKHVSLSAPSTET
jgi:hypothetical protein